MHRMSEPQIVDACTASRTSPWPGVGMGTLFISTVLLPGRYAALIVVLIGLNIALGQDSRVRWLRAPERWGAHLWRRIAPAARSRLPTQPAFRTLVMGLLWGWLPCGLVYSVLLAAAFAGSAVRGSATMAAFGLGTLPAMLGLSYAGRRLLPKDDTFARLLGAVIVACGLWTAAVPIAVLTGTHQHAHHAMVMTN